MFSSDVSSSDYKTGIPPLNSFTEYYDESVAEITCTDFTNDS